jgi:hypothetical protein
MKSILIIVLLLVSTTANAQDQQCSNPEKSWGTVGRVVGEAVVGAVIGEVVRAGADRMRTPSANTPTPTPRPAPPAGNGRDPHHGSDPAPVGHPSARI